VQEATKKLLRGDGPNFFPVVSDLLLYVFA